MQAHPRGMNLIDFGDPLPFHIAPLAGLSFHLSGVVSHHLLVPDGLVKKMCADIHHSLMMYPNDFDDHLTFCLAPQ